MTAQRKDPHIIIAVTPAGIDRVQHESGSAEENAQMLAALLSGAASLSVSMAAVAPVEVCAE